MWIDYSRQDDSKDIDYTSSDQNISNEPSAVTDEVSVQSLPDDGQEQVLKNEYALDAYHDINEDNLGYIYGIWTVQFSDTYSDEELLGLSGMYLGKRIEDEDDGFKKRDLANSLLPQIKAKIDNYKKQYKDGYRIKVPIGHYSFIDDTLSESENDVREVFISEDTFELRQYDFEKKYFPIKVCSESGEDQGFFMRWLNDDNILNKSPLQNWPSTPPREVTHHVYDPGYGEGSKVYMNVECGLSISDEAQARRIEEAIIDNSLASKGYVYYDLAIRKGEEFVVYEPVLADITYFDKQTDEVLANKKFTW